jgi:dGTPase
VLRAKQRARSEIFQFDQKASIELGCYSVVEMLLDGFGEAAIQCAESLQSGGDGRVTDAKLEMLLGMFGDHRPSQSEPVKGGWDVYQCMRRAIDFVSGMTDEFAIRVSRQLSGEMHFTS